MGRGRWMALAAIGVLMAVALVVGMIGPWRDDDATSPGAADRAEIATLRTKAAMDPCPAALSLQLPDLTLACLSDGATVKVKGVPGTPMLINVWGTWCLPCREEVPQLVEFEAAAKGRVGVVGVLTEDPETVSALTYAEALGMHYANVIDTKGTISAAFGQGVPKTLFVDASGAVTFVQRGKIGTTEQLHALVAEHLGVTL